MTSVEKFCAIANKKFNLDLDPTTFRRAYTGHSQRAAGALSWIIFEFDHRMDLGSCDSITELLKHKETIKFDGHQFHIN